MCQALSSCPLIESVVFMPHGGASQMGMKKDQGRRGNLASTAQGNVSHEARGRYHSSTDHINLGL